MMGFGTVSVSGLSRVPYPPTKTNALGARLAATPLDDMAPASRQGGSKPPFKRTFTLVSVLLLKALAELQANFHVK